MSNIELQRKCILDKELGIPLCLEKLNSNNLEDKIEAIDALGVIKNDRRIYPILVKTLLNQDLTECTVCSLATIQDSRALFPLINVINQTKKTAVKQRILQYIRFTKDPRAEDFLVEYLSDTNTPYKEIARDALNDCKGNYDFKYRYCGSEKEHEKAKGKIGQIFVCCPNLDSAKDIFEEDKTFNFIKPQTYIVNLSGELYIGGYLNEHVHVAKGEDILAAGEIIFIQESDKWKVEFINHRSCGYFPARSCFKWVKDFFDKSDVLCDKNEFDEYFPVNGYNDFDFLSIHKII